MKSWHKKHEQNQETQKKWKMRNKKNTKMKKQNNTGFKKDSVDLEDQKIDPNPLDPVLEKGGLFFFFF